MATSTNQPPYAKWRLISQAVRNGSFSGRPVFASIKPIPRILEKIQRCYKNDPTRVTDICRCGIAYDSLKLLSDAIKMILNDPDIQVTGLKNRLDPSYDIDVFSH